MKNGDFTCLALTFLMQGGGRFERKALHAIASFEGVGSRQIQVESKKHNAKNRE